MYVLYSEKSQKSYVGCSRDVAARLQEHNAGRVTATRNGRPWTALHTEQLENYTEARRRERYYKSGAGRRRLAKIFDRFLKER